MNGWIKPVLNRRQDGVAWVRTREGYIECQLYGKRVAIITNRPQRETAISLQKGKLR